MVGPPANATMFELEPTQLPIGVLRAPRQHALGERQYAFCIPDWGSPRVVAGEIEGQPITVAELHVGAGRVPLHA